MNAEITAERFGEAMKWMSRQDSDMDERDVKAFLDEMIGAFRRRFTTDHPSGTVPRFRNLTTPAVSLASIVGAERADAVREIASTLPAAEAPCEPVQVDSVTLLNAIGHVARECGHPVSPSKAQLILYCVYGSWLASHGTRLQIEHPQAWKYGPVFPHAYRYGRPGDGETCRNAYRTLSLGNAELCSHLRGRTAGMLGTEMADLVKVHVRRKDCPYALTVRGNSGRHGVQIEDGLISAYFSRES